MNLSAHKRRNYSDYGNINETAFEILSRGFTGHEHLLEWGIINMNGRIYDPNIGQFMQPDNYISSPDDPYSYNRYIYCMNNPLKYTDPSGEKLQFALASESGSSGSWDFGMVSFDDYITTTSYIEEELSSPITIGRRIRRFVYSMNWSAWSSSSCGFGNGGAPAHTGSKAASAGGASASSTTDVQSNNSVGQDPNQNQDLALGPINVVGSNSYSFFRSWTNSTTQQVVDKTEGTMNNLFKQFEQLYNIWDFYHSEDFPIYILDIDDLDFSTIKESDLLYNSEKDIYSINLVDYGINATSIIFGKIDLKKINKNEYQILPDFYDFNIEWSKPTSSGTKKHVDMAWNLLFDKNWKRNILTIIAGLVNGPVFDNKQIYPLVRPFYIIVFGTLKF